MLTNHNFFAPNYFRLLVLVAPKSAWRLDRTVLLYCVAQCVTMRRYEKKMFVICTNMGFLKSVNCMIFLLGNSKNSFVKTSRGTGGIV